MKRLANSEWGVFGMATQRCKVCNSYTLMSTGICASCQREVWEQKHYLDFLIDLALSTKDKPWFKKLVQEKESIKT